MIFLIRYLKKWGRLNNWYTLLKQVKYNWKPEHEIRRTLENSIINHSCCDFVTEFTNDYNSALIIIDFSKLIYDIRHIRHNVFWAKSKLSSTLMRKELISLLFKSTWISNTQSLNSKFKSSIFSSRLLIILSILF